MTCRLGNRDEIYKNYTEKKEAYKDAKREIRKTNNSIHLLKECMATRLRMWENLRGYVSWRSKVTFTDLMEKRGYRGKIFLNHYAQTLDLKVATTAKELEERGESMDEEDEEEADDQRNRVATKGRDAKTLSGG
jgi:hypothetical protein